MTIGERIKQLREALSLTEEQVAVGADVQLLKILNAEKGNSTLLSIEDLLNIAKFLDVDPEIFYSLEPTEERSSQKRGRGRPRKDGSQQPKPKQVKRPKTLLYPATITVNRYSGLVIMDEMDTAGNGSEVETIEIIPFQTEPARVGIQRGCSMSLIQDDWQTFRIYVEYPCYREQVDDTIEKAVRIADERTELERRKIIMKAGQQAFGENREDVQ